MAVEVHLRALPGGGDMRLLVSAALVALVVVVLSGFTEGGSVGDTAERTDVRDYIYQYNVTTLVDEDNGPDSGFGTSLREAIAVAATEDVSSVDFSVSGTIHLSLGPLSIGSSTKINGPGATRLTIDAGGSSRVFNINSSATISGVTIANGHSTASGGGVHVGGGGSALY